MRDFYRHDLFTAHHKTLYEEDSAWKFERLLPLTRLLPRNAFSRPVLDIGGGAGVITKLLVEDLMKSEIVAPIVVGLDLSPRALARQRDVNPSLAPVLATSEKLPLRNKSVSLTLLIDVIEHVEDLKGTLHEVRRTSDFALLKVPLERNLYVFGLNVVTRGQYKQNLKERVGHIHTFSYRSLESLLNKHLGQVVAADFANVFDYYLENESRFNGWKKIAERLINRTASRLYRVSPRLTSRVFYDFGLFLVKCGNP